MHRARLCLAFALLFCSGAAGQQTVRLGQAVVRLTGPWKFHIGDNVNWARPGFDDSTWGTMDLTPPPGSHDPIFGSSGFVPGWTARGYTGYSGYAWYRLRVNVHDDGLNLGAAGLELKMPYNFDDAYQVYANGRLIGDFGRFSTNGVTIYGAQPRAFPLPSSLESGPLTLAIRMWMDASTLRTNPDAGGLHAPPVLGLNRAIETMLRLDWDTVDRSLASYLEEIVFLLLALTIAFALFLLHRGEPAYLWLGFTCAASLLYAILILLLQHATWISSTFDFLLQDAIVNPVIIGLWVLFWAYWFGLQPVARVHRATWIVVLLLAVGIAMQREPLYGRLIPVHAIVWLSPLTLALKLLLGALLVWVTYRGIRRHRAEAWPALPAVVLIAIGLYWEELIILHIPVNFFPFGFAIWIDQLAIMLSLGLITVLLFRRFLRSQAERERWRLEMEQARQVQQVLIPKAIPAMPGFVVESEYRPAQQVGGDFFQILPFANGTLIAIGDVSGKGLQAAMTVSLIVGTLRTLAEYTQRPAELLNGLNRRLLGRSTGGFTTCLIARIQGDGRLILANAGHIPPYRNGEELVLPSELPLGIAAEAVYQESVLQFDPGDRLTFVSDGVVEAKNGESELFGFERARALSLQPAARIADAAEKFGQQDDITVLTIQRVPVPAYA